MRDIVGENIGKWFVICYSHRNERNSPYFYCICECGKEGLVSGVALKNGATKSCGCYRDGTNVTHGLSHTPEYAAWKGAKRRCYTATDDSYPRYGARGIIVCDRWLNSFINFYEDMGDKPEPKSEYSLERIDVDGNYCPENCKWATFREQGNNTCRTNNGLPDGVMCRDDKYVVRATKDGVRLELGTFDKKEDAAIAYDNQIEDWGEGRPNGTIRTKKLLSKSTKRNSTKKGKLPQGVKEIRNKYNVRIMKNGIRHTLGLFITIQDAATAYDNQCEDWGEGRPNGTIRNTKPLSRASRRDCGKTVDSPKGVRKVADNKYSSRIAKDGVRYSLGIYATELEAAKTYDDKCESFGEGRPNGTQKDVT